MLGVPVPPATPATLLCSPNLADLVRSQSIGLPIDCYNIAHSAILACAPASLYLGTTLRFAAWWVHPWPFWLVFCQNCKAILTGTSCTPRYARHHPSAPLGTTRRYSYRCTATTTARAGFAGVPSRVLRTRDRRWRPSNP